MSDLHQGQIADPDLDNANDDALRDIAIESDENINTIPCIFVPPPADKPRKRGPVPGQRKAILEAGGPEAARLAERKPGRPRKEQPEQMVTAQQGIVRTASREGNIVELVYPSTDLFKEIIRTLHAYDVSEVNMYFTDEGLDIAVPDHLEKSNIYINVRGDCMSKYYCKRPVSIRLDRTRLEKIINNPSRNARQMTLTMREETCRSLVYLELADESLCSISMYEIGAIVAPGQKTLAPNSDDDTNYPIKFILPTRVFKSKINDMSKLSTSFTISKVGMNPLCLGCHHDGIKYEEPFCDSKVISFRSTLPENDILSVTLHIAYVQPLSKSNIGKEIHIAVDKQARISFTANLDKKDNGKHAATIKIYTLISAPEDTNAKK